MNWTIPGCNGGDCCKFYAKQESPFRILTNGHEFKIQERKTTFWSGREYWADVRDYWNELPNVRLFSSLKLAEKYLKQAEKDHYRAFGDWKPVQKTDLTLTPEK
jgi:hypothetical protein